MYIHSYNERFLSGCGFTSTTTKVGKPKLAKDDVIQHENCSATAPFKIKTPYL